MAKLQSGQLMARLVMILIFQILTVYASNGQNGIPPSLKNVNLGASGNLRVEDIFNLIENNSDFTFSYHQGDLGNSLEAVVWISPQEPSMYQALTAVSKAENLLFKWINHTINVLKDQSTSEPLEAEEKKGYLIRGKITDENKEDLPGVNIILKDTYTGTSTELDGSFSLEVPDGEQVLIITFVGYITLEVLVSRNKPFVNVALQPDVESLEEVVVVGYGEQRKVSITGSVVKIETQEITQTKAANVANSLTGRVPGLIVNARGGEPGRESMEILIRGKATTGDASPLFVIDGVANRGTFERLNPEDIESISILKDASAAIYGAQAANGVILITTKRGVEGKPTFNYSNSLGFTQPAQRQTLMNAPQYLTWLDEQNMRNNRPQIYQNIIRDYQEGENDPNIWANTDWWSEAMDRWSPQSQHNISLSGGSPNFRYYISGQHLYQDANFKGSQFGFRQNNIRSNIDVDVTPYLEIGLDLAGRFENTEGSGGVEGLIRGIYNMAPFEAPYYDNGLLRNTSKGNILPGINGQSGGTEIDRQVYNTKLSATLSLDSWVEGLSLSGFAAIDILHQGRKVLQKPYDIFFVNSSGEYENLRANTGNIQLFQQTDQELSKTFHGRINYTRDWGRHRLGGFVAYEQNQVEGEYTAAARINLISADLPYLFTGSQANLTNDGRGWQSARVNYFGRLNYAYADRYLLELTLRKDGSQNFSASNRFGAFPGVSAGWRISEESFWRSDLVSSLKLRGSWGRLGNDRVSNFQYLQIYNVGSSVALGEDPELSIGLTPGRTPNPDITWETAEKTNIGLDVSLSDGLLNLTIDAFYEQRADILAQRNASVPLYTGIELPDENIGKTTNKGIEIAALHRRTISKDFQYRLGGQFTFAKNEIIFIDESPFVPAYQKREGSPIDYLLVYSANGLYQNQEQINGSPHFPDAKPGDVRIEDVNKDGVLNADDRILLPYGPTPRVVYGFSLGASWKGLEFNAFFQGQAGASTIYRPWDVNQDSWYFENRWISEEATPNAASPAAWDMSSSTIQNVSTIWVKNNRFLRIKNVELAYTLPERLTSQFKITNLRVFASAFNLGFIYNSVGLYDPESRSDTGWYYPQQRVVSTGLSITL